MIPLAQLLEDKTFERYFTTTPHLYSIQVEPDRLVWRLWVKSTPESAWRKRDVHAYQTAVGYLLDRIDSIHDGAIQSRGRSYGPPDRRIRLMSGGKPLLDSLGNPRIKRTVWRPSPELSREYGHHDWCFQCRRPTVFGYFRNHPAFRGTILESVASDDVRRCTLCGMSHSFNRTSL